MIGEIGLVVPAIVGLGAIAALLVRGRVGAGTLARVASTSVLGSLLALAVAWVALARAFVSSDWSLRAVAGYSRADASWPYRLAGMWAGPATSLLTATLVLAVAGAWTLRRLPRPGRSIAFLALLVLVGVLAVVTRVAVDPFASLVEPPIDGRGMSPILETPSMLVHPLVLYAGLAWCALPAAVLLGRRSATSDQGRAEHDLVLVRAGRVAWVLLLVAMLVGGRWAYSEVGWGGFWAWDAVENAALAPWLCLTLALHQTGRGGAGGRGWWWAVLPVSLLGQAAARGGAVSSVHAFADSAAVGAVLASVALATALVAGWSWMRDRRTVPSSAVPHRLAPLVAAQARLLTAVLVVVVAGTAWPALLAIAGREGAVVEPRFFAIACGIAALGLLGVMAAMAAVDDVRRRGPWLSAAVAAAVGVVWWAGWRGWFVTPGIGAALVAGVAAVIAGRQRRTSLRATVAHVGVAVFLAGVAASATASTGGGTIEPGGTLAVGDVRVTNLGVTARAPDGGGIITGRVREGAAVTARLDVEWHGDRSTVEPRLVSFPARRQVLGEPALASGVRGDVQISLRTADDRGRVLVEVGTHPLIWLVWVGALLMAGGGGVTAARRLSRRATC